MRLAMADQSSPMLSALKDFAFGSRGPDAMRFEVMSFLREQKVIDAGPHQRLQSWEVDGDPTARGRDHA